MEKKGGLRLFRTEDYWSIWLGMIVIAVAMAFFFSGSSIKSFAVTPGKWKDLGDLGHDLAVHLPGYLVLFLGFGLVFSVSMAAMGRPLKQFIPGYVLIFLGSLAIFYLAGHAVMKQWHLGPPLLALLVGLVIGNVGKLPSWFYTSLRTEYYIKTGIVLLGATLPLTLIFEAGPFAFLQATIVSVVTWSTIFLAAVKLFKMDPRFGAVLGAGGAVCGVSASIAVGGAVKADKDQVAISIGVVSVWAIVMIFTLAFVTKAMIPEPPAEPAGFFEISPGEAGAWVGTSEYADAAGFAVVAEPAETHGDAPIHAFTLMKVIGRDIWIGIWAFVLSIVSVLFWERRSKGEGKGEGGGGARVIWDRFPKFVLGFFAASILMTLMAALEPGDHVGRAPLEGVFKPKAETLPYRADFSGYRVPVELADRFEVDPGNREIRFHGTMTFPELKKLERAAATRDQRAALKELRYRSDWFERVLKAEAIGPIKKFRSWCFVFCFPSIGLSTRFRELATFGMRPFYAFTLGVLINVPLGYILSTTVFVEHRRAL